MQARYYVIVRKWTRDIVSSGLKVVGRDMMTSAKELKTREDWEEVLQSVETVLFDCDGQLM